MRFKCSHSVNLRLTKVIHHFGITKIRKVSFATFSSSFIVFSFVEKFLRIPLLTGRDTCFSKNDDSCFLFDEFLRYGEGQNCLDNNE
jgi:hypothetical protein